MSEQQRNLKADLELCAEFKREIVDERKNAPNKSSAELFNPARLCLANRFGREAEEGWPHAIRRAMEAEQLVYDLLCAAEEWSHTIGLTVDKMLLRAKGQGVER